MASSVVITRKGGPEVLKVAHTEDPPWPPGSAADKRLDGGEVLVDVKCSGINFADIVSRMGLYPTAPSMPFVPGFEASGVVIESTDGRFSSGDKVVGMRIFGAQSSKVVFQGDFLHKIPEGVSFEQAAAVPVNYITAHYALHNLAHLREGETVLVHSAAGGVGTAACQLALHSKAVVIGVAGADGKLEYLKSLGVHYQVNRRKTDFAHQVREICPSGVDVILDPVGGKTFKKNIRLLGTGGRIVAFGVAQMVSYGKANILSLVKELVMLPKVRVVDMMKSNVGIYGLNLTGLAGRTEVMRGIFEKLLLECARGTFKPHIDRIYAPDEIAEAHRYLQSGKSLGKLLISWN